MTFGPSRPALPGGAWSREWPAAPFGSKEESDAHYKRMLDVVLDPVNSSALRVDVASHNLFELAWLLDGRVPHAPLQATPADGKYDKLRLLGEVDDKLRLAAIDAGMWVDDLPVAREPRREMLRWAHEQAVSESRHRHGNVTSRRPGLGGRV